MKSDDKTAAIFRELVGDLSERLSGSRYLADVNSRITAALMKEGEDEDVLLHKDKIGFHLIDWQAEAAFIVALSLFPERFTDEEVRDGVWGVLIHAPSHLVEAARLANVSIPVLDEGEGDKRQAQPGATDNPDDAQ